MTKYQGTGRVEKVEWKAPELYRTPHAVAALIAIPAAEFAWLDITRPFTITQEDEEDTDDD